MKSRNLARAACQEESPAVLRYSQKCPESLDGFLSQTTKFIIAFIEVPPLIICQGASPSEGIDNAIWWFGTGSHPEILDISGCT